MNSYFFTLTHPAFRTILLAAFCLTCGIARAEESSDPFNTSAMLPLKPALRLGEAVGDPCADTRADRALDLAGVVNLALCQSPQTREVWASARAQAAQVGVNQAGYLPNLNASFSGSQNSPGNSQRSIALSLSYLLYDFGARAANLESARQLLLAASATQNNTVQTVFLAAVQSYYQVQATQAAVDAALESERAAKQSFAAAEGRYLAGSATPADKLSAQTAYSQATLNRITAQGSMKISHGTLANLLGLDANQTVTLIAANANPLNQNFEQDIAGLIEQARQRRPDLQAAAAQVKAAEASVDAARAAGRPTISLTASTNQNNNGGLATHGSTVGVNLTVPIFSGFTPTYRVRAAEAQVEVKNAQLERIRLQVALDVWTAYQNLTTATQSLRTTGDLLGSAEQSERVASGRYRAGVGSMLDVLNAQSVLASARQQRVQATLNWNISRATLAQAMGGLDASLLQTLPDGGASPQKSQP